MSDRPSGETSTSSSGGGISVVVEFFLLFNFTEELEQEPGYLTIDDTLRSLNALASIPGCHYVYAGPNARNYVVSEPQQRFAYSFHVRFLSMSDLFRFLKHPDFKRVIAKMDLETTTQNLISFHAVPCQELPRNPRPGSVVRLALCATSSDMGFEFPRFRERTQKSKDQETQSIVECFNSLQVMGQIFAGAQLDGDGGAVGSVVHSVAVVAYFPDWETIDSSCLNAFITNLVPGRNDVNPNLDLGGRALVWDTVIVDYEVPEAPSAAPSSVPSSSFYLIPALLLLALVAMAFLHRRRV